MEEVIDLRASCSRLQNLVSWMASHCESHLDSRNHLVPVVLGLLREFPSKGPAIFCMFTYMGKVTETANKRDDFSRRVLSTKHILKWQPDGGSEHIQHESPQSAV